MMYMHWKMKFPKILVATCALQLLIEGHKPERSPSAVDGQDRKAPTSPAPAPPGPSYDLLLTPYDRFGKDGSEPLVSDDPVLVQSGPCEWSHPQGLRSLDVQRPGGSRVSDVSRWMPKG
jgi:hypothetical protein